MLADPLILVLNAGSSSLKLTAFIGDRIELRAAIERTNQTAGKHQFRDRSSFLREVLDTLATRLPGQHVAAVGHRVVHGGDRFAAPVRITPEILSELEALVPLAPLHQPHNLAEIRAAASLLPGVPQVACFDTAFHATMPKHERMLGLLALLVLAGSATATVPLGFELWNVYQARKRTSAF